MSLDRSLKSANALIRHRNVLTRPERLAKLAEERRWNDSKSVFGLPKVAHRKMEAVKGPAKEKPPTAEWAQQPRRPPAPHRPLVAPRVPRHRPLEPRAPRRPLKRCDPLHRAPAMVLHHLAAASAHHGLGIAAAAHAERHAHVTPKAAAGPHKGSEPGPPQSAKAQRGSATT